MSDNITQLTTLFESFGATLEQSKVMAKQLDKRAKQIAEEKQIDYLEALNGLLKRIAEARL